MIQEESIKSNISKVTRSELETTNGSTLPGMQYMFGITRGTGDGVAGGEAGGIT